MRKDSILFTKINALRTVNNEIIERIKERLPTQVIVGYSYTITVEGKSPTYCYGSIVSCGHIIAELKDQIKLVESKTQENASDIINNWFPNQELKQIRDVFNDKIDYSCVSFEDIARLNKEMPLVAEKYEFFDCTDSAIGIITNFLENMEILQTYLGQIEESLQDTNSSIQALEEGKEKLKQQISEYNNQLEEIMNLENLKREKRVEEKKKLQKMREKDILKKANPNLSFEEASIQISPIFLSYFAKFREWIGTKCIFSRLYRASEDGFSASSFHSKCDNKGATLTLLKSSEGYLFGGYSPIPWTSNDQFAWDPKTFIFSLTNPYTSAPEKYTNTGPSHSNTYSIYNYVSCGPTFGGGYDLHVCNNCNTDCSSSINFPHSFGDTTGRGNNTFVGSKNFTASEIEVYLVSHL